MDNQKIFYVGGYTKEDRFCLHLCQYGKGTAKTRILESYDIENASALCFSPDCRYLYSVIETSEYKGCFGGGIAAYEVLNGGKLRFVNDGFTEGISPCHITVGKDGATLYAANYGSGFTSIFNLRQDGAIGALRKLIDHNMFDYPERIKNDRQENAHAHYIKPLEIDGIQTLWACDLGLDYLLIFNDKGEELTRFKVPDGYGPRHLAFHPSMPRTYAVCEMGNSVIGLRYGFEGNTLCLVEESSVPVLETYDRQSACAAIRVSPGKKHLLVSNRGKMTDSISVLGLDTDGKIEGLKHIIPSGGRCPRDFQFAPCGEKVFIANQESDRICIFDWDEETGLITTEGERLDVQRPSCVLFPAH